MDKAGTSYWDANWSRAAIPSLFDRADRSLNNYVNIAFAELFERWVASRPGAGLSMIEIGCANSIWPVFFHRRFHARVAGLDYSRPGCEMSRHILAANDVPGDVYCADMFDPPADIRGQFDLAISFGVVEHFQDTASALRACSLLLKPGGTLISVIPNLTGLVGTLQALVDRAVYDVHVPLGREPLAAAHVSAGLVVEDCRYFLPISLGVINSGKFSSSRWNMPTRRLLSVISKAVWTVERAGLRVPPSRWLSPYVVATARTPA